MKILQKKDIIQIEMEIKLSNHLTDSDLIDEAANSFIMQFTKIVDNTNKHILILCGNGKNGADGLSIANLLARKDYSVEVLIIGIATNDSVFFTEKLSHLYSSIHYQYFNIQEINNINIPQHHILIDSFLGTGLNRPLSDELNNFINRINALKSTVIAVDIASGVFCDEGKSNTFIRPNYTIALGTIKQAYFLSDSIDFVGKLIYAEMQSFSVPISKISTNNIWIDIYEATNILKPLNRLTHKYMNGSTLIAGGSYGMAGCMKLAGEAALRTGSGIVHLHVPYGSVDFLQSSLPEAIVQMDDNKYGVGPFDYSNRINAIAIGPGMGRKNKQSELITDIFEKNDKIPMVIDADALNILANWKEWSGKIKCPAIITPHKGEFDRLFGGFEFQIDRISFMRKFSVDTGIVIVLKGADTAISTPDGNIYYSNSGNCGMATAGSGDVLTGIIAGLLAQGYNTVEAALLGTQLHSVAGNFAADKMGERSLLAGDIVQHIGMAYQFFEEFIKLNRL